MCANYWGVPLSPEYAEGHREGEQRAITFLSVMLSAGQTDQIPNVLAMIVEGQAQRGFPTGGDCGGIIGFWRTIGRLLVAVTTRDNINRLALRQVVQGCEDQCAISRHVEGVRQLRLMAKKAAATKRAKRRKARRAGKAVRS